MAKNAKAVEIKTVDQLQAQLLEQRTNLVASQKSHHAGELVNPHVLTIQRREIARTLTALKQAETEEK